MVPIERPRVRSTDDQEVRLGSYEIFHRGEPLTETVWEKLMLGLSTRRYGVRQGVRPGEKCHQRTFHRSQPGQVERDDGAAAGQNTVVRAAHRRNAVCRPADGCSAGHQPGRAENDVGDSSRSHRKRHRGGRATR